MLAVRGVDCPSLWVVGDFFSHRCLLVIRHVDHRADEVMLSEVFEPDLSFSLAGVVPPLAYACFCDLFWVSRWLNYYY